MSSFVSFQSLLKDVFTATVQNEDEFTHSSATLAVACIFQLYARAPSFALHQQRVASFNYPSSASGSSTNFGSASASCSLQPPSTSEFASTGFFHTGRSDETVCGACGLGLKDWRPADQADVAHARFARERAESCSLPCLFLEVHRFLTSDLPLTRKNLFSDNTVVNSSVGSLKQPKMTDYTINLAERLRAIALMMMMPSIDSYQRGNSDWPVLNSRDLGYSDDLIALALWRLQSDYALTPTSPVPVASMTITPQSTTLLLKSILRVQESGLGDDESDIFSAVTEDDASPPSLTLLPKADEGEEAASSSVSDDVELQNLSRMRNQCVISIVKPTESRDSLLKTRLPELAQILLWWFTRFPQSPADLFSQAQLSVPARKKANSKSI